MRAIIVDDDLMARESINYLLGKIDDVEVLGSFDSGLAAQIYLKDNKVDVVFLDVEMPEFSGLELLASLNNLPEIILITSNKEYTIEALEYAVLDFIPKPASLVRINEAIERLRLKLEETNIK